MEKYKIKISSSAEKSLKKIPKKDLSRIIRAIHGLATDARPMGSRKLTGYENIFRIRQGVYRIIYEIENKHLVILVLKIAHRKSIYNK